MKAKVCNEFDGVKVRWALGPSSSSGHEDKYYQLIFHRSHRELITGLYLDYVMQEGKAIEARNKQRRLYTNNPSEKWHSYKKNMWSDIAFENPTTFQTLAMDPKKNEEMINDLVTFSKDKEYHAKLGKPWKRGYPFYGPPWTGKSGRQGQEEMEAMEELIERDRIILIQGSQDASHGCLRGLRIFLHGLKQAKQALIRALKAVVRIQAMTLRCMQALVRDQARVRAQFSFMDSVGIVSPCMRINFISLSLPISIVDIHDRIDRNDSNCIRFIRNREKRDATENATATAICNHV